MKASITTFGFSNWGGGVDFLCYICDSVGYANSNGDNHIEILIPKNDVLFYTKSALAICRSRLSSILGRNGARAVIFDEQKIAHAMSSVGLRLTRAPSGLTGQVKYAKNTHSLLFPCIKPVYENIAWVGYIYDFQHKYMPSLFSEMEIEERNKFFASMLNDAKHIIVNSKAVADDAAKFYGAFRAKLHVLPFSPCPKPEWEKIDDVRLSYNITKPFFIVCNQFWKHKDHLTVFRAFRAFLQQYSDVLLVCTGSTFDYRDPDYFKSLEEELGRLELMDSVMILGHIPKLHQISLMKMSVGLVQPTLFEGGPGGGAVYDAISLGVSSILSDIEVNKEVTCGDVSFFRAKDSSDLASKMVDLFARYRTYDRDFEQLLHEGLERKEKCGEFILSVIEKAWQEHYSK